jgi:DNA-directed RNA polymerase subunit E'/Rpb7
MNIISPYKDVEQYTRIKILPHQLNSDIRNHMKLNLKKKVEKKCNKNGFIDNVYRITGYRDGIMHPENLSGVVIYDVSYHCRMCIPVENSVLIAQIRLISQDLIFAVNGPIVVFISRDNVDSNIWDIEENFLHKKEKERLKTNRYVKVEIIAKKINNGDHQIKTIGRLLDYATNTEVEKYYGSVIQTDNFIEEEEKEEEEDDSNFII